MTQNEKEALREKLRLTMDYRFGKGWHRDQVVDAVLDRLFEELPTLAASPTPTDAQPKDARPVGDEALRGPTERQLHAAMDAFYPGEDWRRDLGCALETSLRDMRAAIVAANRMAPEAHLTTGQETVATPRDGGVREPLADAPEDEAVILFTEGEWVGEARMLRDDDTGAPVWTWANGTPVHPNTKPLAWQRMPTFAALSAPGSAGPGETQDRADLKAVCSLCYDRGEETVCEGCRPFISATPPPAQEPGTGDTGERCGYTECAALGRTICEDCRPLATPATTAETRGPAEGAR